MENKENNEFSRRVPLTGSGLLGSLSGIVNDLWGSVPTVPPLTNGEVKTTPAAAPKTPVPELRPVEVPDTDWEALMAESQKLASRASELRREIENAPQLTIPTVIGGQDVLADLLGATYKPAPQPQPAVVQKTPEPKQPALPTFEKLWAVCDEQIDWTAALSQMKPDAGTPAKLWSFYREHAEKVLAGDVTTYVKVIECLQPLEDLLPFCTQMEAGAQSAELVTGSFVMKPQIAGKDAGETEGRLCGMALRVARDLMAMLPASGAVVDGEAAGWKIHVSFNREQLRHARFNRLDPAAFCKECGAEITEKQTEE